MYYPLLFVCCSFHIKERLIWSPLLIHAKATHGDESIDVVKNKTRIHPLYHNGGATGGALLFTLKKIIIALNYFDKHIASTNQRWKNVNDFIIFYFMKKKNEMKIFLKKKCFDVIQYIKFIPIDLFRVSHCGV